MASTGPCTIAPVGSGSYGRSRHDPIRQLRPQRPHTPRCGTAVPPERDGTSAHRAHGRRPRAALQIPSTQILGAQTVGGVYNKPGMISLLFIELRNGISGVIYVRTGSYRIVIVLVWYNSLLRIFLYIRNTHTHTRLVTTQNARTSHITHLHAAYTQILKQQVVRIYEHEWHDAFHCLALR